MIMHPRIPDLDLSDRHPCPYITCKSQCLIANLSFFKNDLLEHFTIEYINFATPQADLSGRAPASAHLEE